MLGGSRRGARYVRHDVIWYVSVIGSVFIKNSKGKVVVSYEGVRTKNGRKNV